MVSKVIIDGLGLYVTRNGRVVEITSKTLGVIFCFGNSAGEIYKPNGQWSLSACEHGRDIIRKAKDLNPLQPEAGDRQSLMQASDGNFYNAKWFGQEQRFSEHEPPELLHVVIMSACYKRCGTVMTPVGIAINNGLRVADLKAQNRTWTLAPIPAEDLKAVNEWDDYMDMGGAISLGPLELGKGISANRIKASPVRAKAVARYILHVLAERNAKESE